MKKYLSLLLLTLFLAGCSWLGGDKEDDDSDDRTYAASDTDFETVYGLMEESLKDQLVGLILEHEMPEKMETSTTMEFSVDFEDEFEAVKADISFSNEDKADLSDEDNPKFEGNLMVSADVEQTSKFFEEETQMNISIEGDVDYKFLDNQIYAILNKFDLSSTDEMISEMINSQVTTFLGPWTNKWLTINVDEIAQNMGGASMMNFDQVFQAWTPAYMTQQIEMLFGPDLLTGEFKEEKDGYLVYDVSLNKDGLVDLFVLIFEQSALSDPQMISEIESEMRRELSYVDLEGEMSVLKEDVKYFTLNFDLKETDMAVGTMNIEWLSDRKTMEIITSDSNDPQDGIYLEWLSPSDDEGTIFLGTSDRVIKAVEGEYEDDNYEFTIYLNPEDWENSPTVVGELEESNDTYSGSIVIPEEAGDIELNLDAFEFSDDAVKMIGNIVMEGNELFSINLESNRKEVNNVTIEAPEGQVESLTPILSNLMSLMMMGMQPQGMPSGDPFGGDPFADPNFGGMEGTGMTEEDLQLMMEELMADPAMMEMIEEVEIPAE